MKLSTILGAAKAHIQERSPTGKGAAERLQKALNGIKAENVNPYKACYAVDVGASNANKVYELLPALTASRCATGGYWLTNKGRMTATSELLAAQGFDRDVMDLSNVAATDLGRAVGNSMSVPVVQAVLANLLPSVGL